MQNRAFQDNFHSPLSPDIQRDYDIIEKTIANGRSGHMISRRLEFEKLLNTRDLGGMTGADGRKIRSGKLFRSGHLAAASSGDLEKLAGMIGLSIDFRTDQECSEKPEPQMKGVKYTRIPILEEQDAGVTRDQASFKEVLRKMVYDANIARTHMIGTYRDFITKPHCVSQYERFARLLLDEQPKGILWHCTAGKDRAGFGTVIVEELLGVSRQDIRDDYIYTNTCLEPDIRFLTEKVCSQPGVNRETAAEAVAYIFSAQMDYLDSAYEIIGQEYGSFENYIRLGLHISHEEQEKIREMYLE